MPAARPTPSTPDRTLTAPTPSTDAAPSPDAAAGKPPTATPAGLPSRIEPRDFGLTLGDVVRQRIALPVGTGPLEQIDIDLRQGRFGTWVERRSAHRETDSQGRDWLVVEHQVVNVAATPRPGELPAQSVTTRGGARLEIAPVTLGLAPVAAVATNVLDTLSALRPDHAAPTLDVPVAERRLQTAAVALAALLLAWLAVWRWREWHDARRRPFARALRTLARAKPDAPEAWQAVHHALNEAAGRSVHATTIASLYERAPTLCDEHAAIERFFAASNARFFARANRDAHDAHDAPAATAPAVDLLDLAKRLRRLEKAAT